VDGPVVWQAVTAGKRVIMATDRPHYALADGRWERRDPDGTVTPMPSGWRPGKHPPDVK
jgi:hypothetical protein